MKSRPLSATCDHISNIARELRLYILALANAMSDAAPARRKLKLTGRLIQPEPARTDFRSRAPFRPIRRPRIVILDDVEAVRDFYRVALLGQFPDAQFVCYADGDAAFAELCLRDPDLFITDITHPGMHVAELVGRLGERRITYPVAVVSAVLDSCNQDIRTIWSSRLRISFWQKPVAVGEWVSAMHGAVVTAMNDL